MSVFLLILKILGIVILSILAFILLVLILVLAVPFRYRGHFEKKEAVEASGSFSWLLRIIEVRVNYGADGLTPEMRIFWFFRK
ncbi:MAG: hypothetical protein IKY02_04500, partial [Lachnospiraceae bacterium]|nr:hypothetical protein [Lachnospiraceae bacterium]